MSRLPSCYLSSQHIQEGGRCRSLLGEEHKAEEELLLALSY